MITKYSNKNNQLFKSIDNIIIIIILFINNNIIMTVLISRAYHK